MINIINTVSGISRVNVDSAWYSSNGKIEHSGNAKNNIKSNHYLFVKLTCNGLTENQKISNLFFNMF